MTKKQKKRLARILAAAVLLLAVHFLPLTGAAQALSLRAHARAGRAGGR